MSLVTVWPPTVEDKDLRVRPGVRFGVDVGSVRVGVASCDPDAILATPVDTLARRSRADAAAQSEQAEQAGQTGQSAAGQDEPSIAELAAMVADAAAIEVVVGLPRGLDGSEGAAAAAVRAYARLLAAAISPVRVRLVDERLTTVDAHRALYSSGRTGRRHRTVVDRVAAVMILQGALDAERESGAEPGEVVGARKPRHRRPRA